MRANLPDREPAVYQQWVESSAFDRMDMNRLGGVPFTLHDGPPYANGNIHIGTAMNKILKDFVVKHRYMNGARVYWKPGWDCHGLPIERNSAKELAEKGTYNLTPIPVRASCRAYADRFVRLQMEQFQALGVVADWQRPYTTHTNDFEAEIYHKLCMMAKQGYLYERQKPVLWSWKERTALASTEVDYKDHECNSVYVAMNFWEKYFSNSKIVIWTTTPWTLPANVAVAVHPTEKYVLTGQRLIVAEKRHAELVKLGVVDQEVVNTFSGEQLKDGFVENPLRNTDEFKSKIVVSEDVDMLTGTGCVHIAPGHGELDYELGVKNKLPVVMPVDEKGCYTEDIDMIVGHPLTVGMHVFDADDVIVELLTKEGAVLKHDKLTHSYPFCERSDTPVIFRATKQWFVKMDALREDALGRIDGVKFTPESGRESLEYMIKSRPDWCISRQRSWGVPIAFLRHKKTGRYLLGEDVLTKIEQEFRKRSSDAWFHLPIEDFLPEDYRYKPEELEKVTDVLDVWFDSGSTWHMLGSHTKAGKMPADLYLEGRDQYRGWFSSSLLLGTACANTAPFKEVVCHGFVTDKDGRKMAKRDGNVVAPSEVLKTHGAEILRMWVATSDFTKDLRVGKGILDSVAKEYAKLRNTFRFLLGNIAGYEGPKMGVELKPLDGWICTRARKVFGEVNQCFFDYQFAKGMHKLMEFVHHDLSGLYMNAVKDRMYCGSCADRKSGQQAMMVILRAMTGLLAPILTFTCDEVLSHSPNYTWRESHMAGRGKDIFDFSYTPIRKVEYDFDETLAKEVIAKLHELTDELKREGKLKNPLELMVGGPDLSEKGLTNETMEEWLVVSKYAQQYEPIRRVSNDDDLVHPTTLGNFKVGEEEFTVFHSNMEKCPRCWKHNVNVNPQTDLCNRCESVIQNEHGARRDKDNE
tara:strand:+ start:6063 stop:8822 length:2760 start_codon:yes stop_codon:yes gene_type:complete